MLLRARSPPRGDDAVTMAATAVPCAVELRLRLIEVAQEAAPPDLLIRGPRVWNAFTGEVMAADIAVAGDRIARVAPWFGPVSEATTVIDAAGMVAVPGYIEPHTHPWPFANPLSLGEAAVRRGTTCLVYDDLLLHLTLGEERLARLTAALSAASLPSIFWVARIASQSLFRGEDAFFSRQAVERLLARPQFIGTGEMTRWTDLLRPDTAARLVDLLEMTRRLGKVNDGHMAGASAKRLAPLAAAAIHSCHEATTADEALERLRQGLWVLLRNSSLRPDLEALLPCLGQTAFHDRLAFTSDGAAEPFIEDFGLTDHMIRLALAAGVAPRLAYRMATLNAAAFLGLDGDMGALAPGRIADVNLLSDLAQPLPRLVVCRGRLAAREGALVDPAPSASFPWDAAYAGAVPPRAALSPPAFLLPISAPDPFPAGRLTNAAITRETPVALAPRAGGLWPSEADTLVLAATDRQGRWISRGVVQNLAPELDAVATTYTTHAGLLVLGRSPEAMAEAMVRLCDIGGGFLVKPSGGDWCGFPLPMAGIHGRGGFPEAVTAARGFQAAMAACGYRHADPKYSLLFLTADMLPEVRATEAGWVRVKTGDVLMPAQWLK